MFLNKHLFFHSRSNIDHLLADSCGLFGLSFVKLNTVLANYLVSRHYHFTEHEIGLWFCFKEPGDFFLEIPSY